MSSDCSWRVEERERNRPTEETHLRPATVVGSPEWSGHCQVTMAHRVSGGCRFCDGRAATAFTTIRATDLGRRPGSVDHPAWKPFVTIASPGQRSDVPFIDTFSPSRRRVVHAADRAPTCRLHSAFPHVPCLERSCAHRGRRKGIPSSSSCGLLSAADSCQFEHF